MWLRGMVAALLNLPMSHPSIVDMSTDEVEMTYAFHNAKMEVQWQRLERILGTTWKFEDVVKMQPKGPQEVDDEGEAVPQLLGPGEKAFYPLALALNPGMYKEVIGRFHKDAGIMVLGDGERVEGDSLFNVPKDEFMRLVGARNAKKAEEANYATPKQAGQSIQQPKPVKQAPTSKRRK